MCPKRVGRGTTRLVGDTVHVVGSASYLAFGENKTLSRIVGLTTSLGEGVNAKACYNSQLDDGVDTAWKDRAGRQFIALEVEKSTSIEKLLVYSERRFPEKFDVFIVPEGEKLPTKENLSAWETAAARNGWQACSTVCNSPCQFQTPYQIPLGGLRGKQILIAWNGAAGNLIDVREFLVTAGSSNAGSIGFAGQWIDKETGLIYQLNRYRLPALNGKFISPDPLGFADGMNYYAYAHNNPLSWHDPDGEFAHILSGAGIGAIVGGGMYAFSTWMNGDEFSWKEFGVATVAGAASGAVAAATFGAVPMLGGSTLLTSIANGALTGMAAGATHGAISNFGNTLIAGGSLADAGMAGLRGGAESAVIGAIGGAAGGAVLGGLNIPNRWGGMPKALRGFITATTTGAGGGGAAGAAQGAWHGYQEGGVEYAMRGAVRGGARGAAAGAAGGALAFGVGTVADKIKYGNMTRTQKWNHDRKEYWKNEATRNSEAYSPENLARMQQGKAPQQMNPVTGKMESTHLHHKVVPQRAGLPSSLTNSPGNIMTCPTNFGQTKARVESCVGLGWVF